MSIGLFLDVDNTLTKGFIQEKFAELLGCTDEYCGIEMGFQQQVIDATEFGKRLISLFSERGFTDEFAATHFGEVETQEWTEEVLRLPVVIYLVSSGPNYYIDRLAQSVGIPQHRTIRSQYRFDKRTGLIASCRAVSALSKANFVRTNRRKHVLTIGVGDSLTLDGPFISHCSFPILTNPNDGYFSMQSFEALYSLVDNLSQAIRTNAKPRVFIGSTSEALSVAQALQAGLEGIAEPVLWTQGIFAPSLTSIEALERAIRDFDFAVLVTTPDDTVHSRGKEYAAVRDNVLFELGLFMGALGRSRCFLVQPRSAEVKLPTDVSGLSVLEYDDQRSDKNIRASLGTSSTAIVEAIEKLGSRNLPAMQEK